MTNLWGASERILVSDVDSVDKALQSMVVKNDVSDANPNDYAIVLCAADYVACRLREIPLMGSLGEPSLVRSPAAVRFMASAMMNPKHTKDPEVQIVAQLDQLYAYMLMLTPVLPEPYKSIWKKDMKKIVDILITQFYSEHYKFFGVWRASILLWS